MLNNMIYILCIIHKFKYYTVFSYYELELEIFIYLHTDTNACAFFNLERRAVYS